MKFTIWKTYECLVSVFFKVFLEGENQNQKKIQNNE